VAEPDLSTPALNRALLARQLLLERSDLPLTTALERVAGLQTQYAPTGYIGLWARVRDFQRDDLTDALMGKRAVQATLMRSTIHMVSADDYWPFAVATRRARSEWWVRAQGRALADFDLDAATQRARQLLADGPRRHAEMLKLMAAEGYPRLAWVAAAQLLDVVRVPPSGTWEQRRADLYGLAEDWLGLPPRSLTEASAREHLVRRYLAGFGPASLADVATFAGLPPSDVRAVVDRLDLRRFRGPDGKELLDVPDGLRPGEDVPAPVRFLSTWEAALLVHARRTGILPERLRPIVFNTKTPHSVPTFLVDGAVAGTWRHEKGRIATSPFEPLSKAARREVDAEADRLTAFHAG
jgi:hypothetical protein